MPQRQDPKEQLIDLLQSHNVVLMTGAGSSMLLDDPYPSWRSLLNQMRDTLLPSFNEYDGNDALRYTDNLKKKLADEDRLDDYRAFLFQTFRPKSKNYDDIHVTLVQIPFAGIVTTNFDRVLEDAAASAFTTDASVFSCEPIDLCNDWPYEVFSFLRQLSFRTGNISDNRTSLLHLHGLFKNPDGMILTQSDYLKRYIRVGYDSDGKLLYEAFDTLHHKVIFALSAMHPLLFVGFSLQDPMFMNILKVVKKTFRQGTDPMHFALYRFIKTPGITQDQEKAVKEDIIKQLKIYGVHPIFFDVPEGSHDYNNLKVLIKDLANAVGTPTTPNTMAETTDETLRM